MRTTGRACGPAYACVGDARVLGCLGCRCTLLDTLFNALDLIPIGCVAMSLLDGNRRLKSPRAVISPGMVSGDVIVRGDKSPLLVSEGVLLVGGVVKNYFLFSPRIKQSEARLRGCL